MALFGFELDDIARLVALVEAHGLEEFLYEEEGRSLRICGPRSPVPPASMLPVAVPAPATPGMLALPAAPPPARPQRARRSTPSSAVTVTPADQVVLDAPIVGVFYRAEKPGAPPLVNVGDRVAVGQVLGVLEAMKVFSEFKAEHAGVIVAIPATDGQLVHVGTPLIVLKKS